MKAFDHALNAPRTRRFALFFGLFALSTACGEDADDAANEAPHKDVLQQTATRQSPDASTMDAGIAVIPRADAGRADGGAIDDGALWCAVKEITDGWCTSCHDGEGTLGSPMSLLTYEDFFTNAPLNPSKKTFEVVAVRMNDARRPMPPIGRLDPPDLQAVNDWIAAGTPPPPKGGCATLTHQP